MRGLYVWKAGAVRARVQIRTMPRHSAAPWKALPSWAFSLFLHASILLAVALSVRPPKPITRGIDDALTIGWFSEVPLEGPLNVPPPKGNPDGDDRPEGQAEEKKADEQADEEKSVEDPADRPADDGQAQVGSLGPAPPVALKLPTLRQMPSRVGPGPMLPRRGPAAVGQGVMRVGNGRGPRGVADGVPGGKGGAGRFFGVEARGTRFVYIVDASGSMSEHSAFAVAKSELRASLQQLDSDQSFQVIFYNDDIYAWKREGSQQQVYFATDINKNLVAQFIGNFSNRGGTRHMPALEAAIKLNPDVIFFLTDAAQPEHTAAEIDKIQRRCESRVTIHTVEFGVGESLGVNNFLKKLAAATGGQSDYRDVQKFD